MICNCKSKHSTCLPLVVFVALHRKRHITAAVHSPVFFSHGCRPGLSGRSTLSGPVARWIRHRPTEPGIAGSLGKPRFEKNKKKEFEFILLIENNEH